MKITIAVAVALLWASCEGPREWLGAEPESRAAPYSVPLPRLDAAWDCRGGAPDGGGRSEPVLLVHGTGVTRAQNWGWSYWPALEAAGFDVCWVALPGAALGDMQVTAEYIARAAESIAHASGEPVDIVGHSQGGVVARWAVKYFSAGDIVDDLVAFAAPNHGTEVADRAARAGKCFAACWQMRPGSDFLSALNGSDETPDDISYTNIATVNDEFVTPVESSALAGGSNVIVQDVCRGRPVEHLLLAGDAVTWELTVDALTHPGPAVASRISSWACLKLALPGATLDWPTRGADTGDAAFVDAEPALKPYAN